MRSQPTTSLLELHCRHQKQQEHENSECNFSSSSSQSACKGDDDTGKTPHDIFNGWVRKIRFASGGSMVFMDVYDGTMVGHLRCIVSKKDYDSIAPPPTTFQSPSSDHTTTDKRFLRFEEIAQHVTIGCAVEIQGSLSTAFSPLSDNKHETSTMEFVVNRVSVFGKENHPSPLSQRSMEKSFAKLRTLPFCRFSSQTMQCIFRIRSKLNLAVHVFMDNHDVVLVDVNTLTTTPDCYVEGATRFQVLPHHPDEHGESYYLASSLQMPLEAATHGGFPQVYAFQKVFYCEQVTTRRDLAEMSLVTYEAALLPSNETDCQYHHVANLEDLLNHAETFLKTTLQFAMDRCQQDLDWLEGRMAPTDIDPIRVKSLHQLLQCPIVRITHGDAVNLIRRLVEEGVKLPNQKDRKLQSAKIKFLPDYESDLAPEHVNLLVRYFGYQQQQQKKINSNDDNAERSTSESSSSFCGALVFVTHWPQAIMPFLVADNNSKAETESFVLYAPRVGKLLYGSMHEWRHDKLVHKFQQRKSQDNTDGFSDIQWYLDLRQNGGSMPHGGWTVLFDRLVMLLCGVPSIHDVVPFPVECGHCPY